MMNFDNVFEAMSSIFIMGNAVSWSNLMYHATKSQGIDMVSSETIVNPYTSLFFVIVVVIGNFFLSNLYIGVIITAYNR